MSKVAVLIDGGYFLKRLPSVTKDIDVSDPDAVARSMVQMINTHLEKLNEIAGCSNHYSLLYRCFYYDAVPYDKKAHTPITNRGFDYAKSDEARFRSSLFEELRRKPNFAVRLGHVYKEKARSWILKDKAQKALLNGAIAIDDLTDDDFAPALHQKGVDMRIGVDITSLTLKKQVDTIILVSGDADFVPAAKLARREGVRFILDPLWRDVAADLFEHIDGLRSGFPRPKRNGAAPVGKEEN